MAENIICPECGSVNIYFSKKQSIHICEDCDNSFHLVSDKKHKIFFSYGHDDNEKIVQMLKTDLENKGYDIWFDRSKIKKGNDWRKEITDGILASDSMVAFLSKHSVREPGVCLDEINIGLSHIKGNIQTVLLESKEEISVPQNIKDIQYLDMSAWRDKISDSSVWMHWYNSHLNELVDGLEDPSRKNFRGDIRKIQDLLRPIESDLREKMLLCKPFVGRQWLDNEIEQWRTSNSESKAFIIYAPPGIGKSRYAVNQLYNNRNVICGVFCEWNKPDYNNPTNIIKLISFKLATKLYDYRQLLMKRIDDIGTDRIHTLSLPDLFNQLLSQPLSETIDGSRERQLIIIDGIDETADQNMENLLAVSLSDNINNLPKWLSFVITCRPESNIIPFFKSYNPKAIDTDGDDNLNDIKQYLEENLQDILYDEQRKSEVIGDILNKCQGSFLYVSLLTENIKLNGLDVLSADGIPNGLDAFYYNDFMKKFNSAEQYENIRGFLEILIAFREMPKSLYHKILGVSNYSILRQADELGSLLVPIDCELLPYQSKVSSYRFYHKSIVDWLSDYSASLQYFIDKTYGLQKALSYFKKHIHFADDMPEGINQNDEAAEQLYMQNSIINCFVQLNKWQELELFLLCERTPLYPYWQALGDFPQNYNTSGMVDYIRNHNENIDFFSRLQRSGERTLCADIIGKIVEQYGIGSLSIDIFTIYADIIHIGGEYKKAVSLYDNFIASYKDEEVYSNPKLFYIAIRRIHHKMFFCPVNELISESMYLLNHINQEEMPDKYNELLFLIGGNLGILSGDIQFAELWTEKAFRFSIKTNNRDFEIRAVRKQADILCYYKKYNDALKLTQSYFKYDDELSGYSRYYIYLLGALGEIYRHLGEYDISSYCYNKLLDVTDKQGLKGWKCHALLGQAMLAVDRDNLLKAESILGSIQSEYEQLEFEWGIISSKIVSFFVSYKSGINPSELTEDIDYWKRKAHDLKYRYNEFVLDELNQRRVVPDYHLFFV